MGELMSLQPLLLITVGISVGILAGAMPGVSPSMGVALMVPFTYAMDPSMALVYLAAIYLAANYGGAITAIMINTPGTPSAVVTSFDGYPLCVQGRAREALGLALVASFVGGAVGTVVLMLFASPLASVALKFWPAEYFSLAVLGLSTIASMGGENALKSAISAAFGLLICTVGMDPVLGVSRFTFGNVNLFDGFEFIPMLIGLLALSEIFVEVEGFDFRAQRVEDDTGSKWPGFLYYWKYRAAMMRASIIGTIVGIFPGAGATIAAFISYDMEKKISKTPEKFGTGLPEGVIAGEAADSASVGGALVPMLTLGIPGSATAAVLMGALMIHDLQPGPELFVKNPEVIYRLYGSLLLGNVIMLILGIWGSKLWINVTASARNCYSSHLRVRDDRQLRSELQHVGRHGVLGLRHSGLHHETVQLSTAPVRAGHGAGPDGRDEPTQSRHDGWAHSRVPAPHQRHHAGHSCPVIRDSSHGCKAEKGGKGEGRRRRSRRVD